MHILLVNNSSIPVYGYGGTERVIWDLGKTLVQQGHRVSYLVPEGSTCDFGQVLPIRPDEPWEGQIPADVDITHFQFNPRSELSKPYLVTEHGNARKPKPLPLKLDAVADIAELTVPTVQELSRLAPFGSGNPVPVFLLQNAAVDGIWPLGSEGRHCRIRLRQGGAACFVSLFGTAPDDLPYRMGTAVDAAVEVSIFQGRGGPMVSCHCCAMRPAGLGNAPAEQAARFDAFLSGTALPDDERLACLPTRADTAAVYRMVRTGNVFADDLQPLFATAGPENTGKTLASLTALEQLGLIERRGSRYQPVEVTGKKDLSSAPVLRRLAEGEG